MSKIIVYLTASREWNRLFTVLLTYTWSVIWLSEESRKKRRTKRCDQSQKTSILRQTPQMEFRRLWRRVYTWSVNGTCCQVVEQATYTYTLNFCFREFQFERICQGWPFRIQELLNFARWVNWSNAKQRVLLKDTSPESKYYEPNALTIINRTLEYKQRWNRNTTDLIFLLETTDTENILL